MTDEELIAEARRVGYLLSRCSGDVDRLAAELLRQLADLAERLRPTPVLGGGAGAPGLGGHRRWHVNRGEHNPDCRYCQSAAQAAEAEPPPV